MKFPPRPYQIEAFTETRESLRYNQRVILCMPTGAGKTVTFSDIALSAVTNGKRVMVLCDRKELISQAYDKVTDYGLSPTIIAPKHRQIKNSSYIASVDTLVRREAPAIDLLIIDEAHKRRFDKIITDIYPNTKTIGATATPIRPWKHSLHNFYSDLIEPVDIPELIRDRFLNPARTFGPTLSIDDVKISYNAELGENDFNTDDQFKQWSKPGLYDGVIDNYIKFTPGTKAIVFNVNVAHSKRMTEEFNRRGILSYHIDGTTPDWMRKQILQDFRDGKFLVLNNCSIFTTGFDEPSIETVIINRKTISLALWLQMCGRGSRLCDEIGKMFFNIIDHGGNVWKHGLWESPRTFSLMSDKPRRTSLDVAPVKECPECEEILNASAAKCSCGYVFPVKESVLIQSEFKELTGAIIATPSSKTYKGGVTANIWKMSDQEIRAYGAEQGYKPGWADIQIKRVRGIETPNNLESSFN
jgi:superfamily II DNA or RNA helicase